MRRLTSVSASKMPSVPRNHFQRQIPLSKIKYHIVMLYKTFVTIFITALAASCTSGTNKPSELGDNTYYPMMNDSIALSSLFKSVAPDTDFLAKHQIRVLTGIWNAPNIDSVKGRYPKAQLEGRGAEPIMVYYTINNTMKYDSLYRIDYSAQLASSNKIKGDIGFNIGVAIFSKNKEGWHLKSNSYNPEKNERPVASSPVAIGSGSGATEEDNTSNRSLEQRIEKLERQNEQIEARFQRDEDAINRVGRAARYTPKYGNRYP